MELVPTVVSGRWFHSRAVLWKEFLKPLLEESMLTSGSAVTRYEVKVSVDVQELMLDLIHHNESAYPPPLF